VRRRSTLILSAAAVVALSGTAWSAWKTFERKRAATARREEYRRLIDAIPKLNARGKFQELGASGFARFWSEEVLLRLKRARFPLDALQRKLVERGSILKEPASEAALDALSIRLELDLPLALRQLYLATNGLYTYVDYAKEPLALFEVEQVRWLHEVDPTMVRDWMRILGDRPPDATYFKYGADQDVVNIRTEYMRRMVCLSPLVDGAALCLNSFVRFPSGELEAWDFSVKYPGARRYQTLAEMFEDRCQTDCWNIDEWSATYAWRKTT
jgi:hypothetical protein